MKVRPELIEQYHGALNHFAPPGKLIPQNPDSSFQKVLRAEAEDFALLHQFAEAVAFDCIPGNTSDMLDEWEQSCGLPQCQDQTISTLEGRRAQVVTKLSQNAGRMDGKNGSSAAPAYLELLAKQAGFEVKVVVRYPIRFGRSRFGDPFGSPGKIDVRVKRFNYGVVSERLRFLARFGQPFGNADIRQLECILNKAAPARYQFFYHVQEDA